MRTPSRHNLKRAQTSLEYLLLLAVVAVVVIGSFGPNSLIQQVHDSAQNYFSSVTDAITGAKTPKAINGGLCPAAAGVTPACECPVPAFGGKPC